MPMKTTLTALGLAASMAVSMNVGAQSTDFSGDQIDQFVEAQNEVMKIRNEYVQRIESTEDRDKAMALEQEGNEMMVEAVEDTGLEVDTYSSIARAASENSDLAERIQSKME